MDFSSAAMNWFVPPPPNAESGIFPRFRGACRNPFTGNAFASWAEICDYMRASGQSVFRYYTSNDPDIVDINGATLPTGRRVTFEAVTHGTITATVFRPTVAGCPEWIYQLAVNVEPKTQTLRRGPLTVDSIAAAPDHVGQQAVAGGAIYSALNTASPADWKQIWP